MTDYPFDHVSPVWTRYTDFVVDRGEGSYLYATDGRRYLDFTCGIAVTNTGHSHPRVVAAIREQAGKLIHGQANLAMHPPMLALVESLRAIFPPRLDTFFFSNSGAEAIEGAVKLARVATRRPNVIVFQGSFHGRTAGTMSLTTSKTIYRAGYQPLMPGVFVAPFPYAYRYGWDPKTTVHWCLEELRFLLATQTAPEETAAMLIEPVLGEGGYVVPPPGFLEGVRQICDEHGILLIADEIQSGMGRTGKWWGFEHFNIVPDIVTVAKGIASGLPLSAVVSRKELMDRWPPGSHGGTFGGNVIACAAGVATIAAIQEEGLLQNAAARGEQLMTGLRHLQEEQPGIGDVRGLGLMLGAEFTSADGRPDKAAAKQVVHDCLDAGLVLLTCGPWDNTIRFIPPLTVSEAEIGEGLAIVSDAVRKL
ncbi:MAG TPA: aminotransferase class III-fold pyridoxal phosphate-dependent enzyme [Anaerolineales bacterium]|nr:aminotransferase class III-fold pyridoxal phosphate-dependent enzyme [Anaerolineales bacterium]